MQDPYVGKIFEIFFIKTGFIALDSYLMSEVREVLIIFIKYI